MPQRFLRPGITTSKSFNSTSWMAQSLFVRIITLVDDYGRFEYETVLLKSLAFPYNPEINCEQMLSIVRELIAQKLIFLYAVDGRTYLQVLKWKEKPRAGSSRCPCPDDGTPEHLLAIDSKCSAPSSSSSPSSSPSTIVDPVNTCKHPVNTCKQLLTPLTQAEADTKTRRSTRQQTSTSVNKSQPASTQPNLPTPNGSAVVSEEPKDDGKETAKHFIDIWHLRHLDVRGCKYAVQGAKDASNAKRLLQTTGLRASELVDLAEKAWKLVGTQGAFYVKHAASIATFASHYNSIRQEVDNLSSSTKTNQSTNGYVNRTRTEQVADERNKFISDTRSEETKAADEAAFWARQDAWMVRNGIPIPAKRPS